MLEFFCSFNPVCQGFPLTCWTSGEVQQIETCIEHFIAEAHNGEHIFLIVQTKQEIFVRINEFVGGFACHRDTGNERE